ncbi:MAG TPA: roadblock/LC7 domain-containing protein [Verrucomicrobiae bacterium]|nr:roadblock/LC7 domain-containing protein [Verrucomicrobiae bacterium]
MSASSNGGKSGLFGILKGLFRKSDATSTDDDAQAFVNSAPLAPPPVEVSPAPSPVHASPRRTHSNGMGSASGIATIAVPLQSILNGLPGELRGKVRVQAVGDLTVNVALDKVLSQLSHGVVAVPFGDIRQAAPHVFAPGVESDQVPVPLPLNEVLSRINPALLVRRGAQRQVEVPSDITSPFDSPGQELSISVGNIKPVQPAAPRRAAPAPQVPARGSISSVNTPPAPAGGANPAASIPFSFTKAPTPASSSAPTPFPTITPITPVNPIAPAHTPTRQPQPQPQFHTQFQPRPQPQPQPIPMPKAVPTPAPGTESAVIPVALNAISENWPEALLHEMAQQGLTDARVALPVDSVETGLKRGKVTFNWKSLRSWIRPALPPAVSAHDALELELPLKILAPLFITRKQPPQPQQKLTVDAEIPNLFFGFPQPEAPAPAAPSVAPTVPFAPAPVPSPAAAAAAAASAAAASAAASAASAAAAFTPPTAPPKSVDTNYYIWDDASDTTQLHIEALRRGGAASTEFVKRYASPNEIVSRAVALDGVAGALIALPDGLMVASRIPMELNADTLAAFLPQLFNKVSQCTKELRMGELNNLNFTVGNVPWKIFRVNAIFFAVFGRPAQPLPSSQLAALAAELDRKNK